MSLPTLLRKGALIEQPYMDEEERKKLPNIIAIDYIIKKIDSMLRQKKKGIGDNVLILRAGTGAGKSTTIAPELYLRFNKEFRPNIAITQPRILTSISIPTAILNIPNYSSAFELEKNIGYNTAQYKRLPKENGITFMLTGSLSNQITSMSTHNFITKYKFIIIDEIHERDIEIELILILLKTFFKNHWDDARCPILILMSATFDPNIFMKYFEVPEKNFIDVAGETFHITDHFAKYDIENYIDYTVDVVKKIHNRNKNDQVGSSDIIIFVAQQKEAKAILIKLNEFNVKNFLVDKDVIDPIILTKATYTLGKDEYIHTFAHIDQIKTLIKIDGAVHIATPTRRVIIATNVAETGVTIESLKYCIDTGYVLSPDYNPQYDAPIVAIKCITKGMAIQRRGRVGRKSEGEWFPCYTKKTFDLLASENFSRLLTEDITHQYLSIFCSTSEAKFEECRDGFKRYKYERARFCVSHNKIDVSKIDFLESPSADMLQTLIEKLNIYGYIDCNYNITPSGMFANSIRKIGLDDIRFIFSGYYYGANILDLITIVAYKNIRNITQRRYTLKNPIQNSNRNQYLFYTHALIADELIDKVFLFNDYLETIEKAVKGKNFEFTIQSWCEKNMVDMTQLSSMVAMRDEIILALLQEGINPFYNGLKMAKGTYNLTNIFNENLQDGMDEIIKIKQCIYNGYKFNLLKWDKEKRTYIHVYKHYAIDILSPVLKPYRDGLEKPTFIIAQGIKLNKSQRFPRFEFKANNISVMDGFVKIDSDFFRN